MIIAHRTWLCGLALLALLGASARAEVVLLGEASLPGNSSDLSGLKGHFENGIPFDQLGGISAIEHVTGDQYILLPDRGPADGAVPYATRFHLATIRIPESGSGVTLSLTETRFLTKKGGQPLVGAASALLHGGEHPGRLDPEGLRVIHSANGENLLAISDEYGPRIDLYNMQGQRAQKLKVPEHFQVEHPSADPLEETSRNHSGRQPNSGFESLAVSPDGGTLYSMVQRPLMQDGATDAGKTVGRLNRILKIDIATGATAEFVYVLDGPETGVSEMLCIDQHRALVLERDGQSGTDAKIKRIALIDFDGASDVSHVESLPSSPEQLSAEIKPVAKRAFVDLLDPRFHIAGENAPAKFEGLTFGPDRADGRKTLLVSVDNDFQTEKPTRVFAFAISAEELGQ